MKAVRLPIALEERIGPSGSAALAQVLDETTHAFTEHVMMQCTERFERRLVEETSQLRIEMAGLVSDIRGEMQSGFAALRHDMAAGRFELLKWAFAFWVGQLVTVGGLMALLLKTGR